MKKLIIGVFVFGAFSAHSRTTVCEIFKNKRIVSTCKLENVVLENKREGTYHSAHVSHCRKEFNNGNAIAFEPHKIRGLIIYKEVEGEYSISTMAYDAKGTLDAYDSLYPISSNYKFKCKTEFRL